MARYTCSYIAKVPFAKLQPSLVEILHACNFETVYQTSDYLMAQEAPGQVPFAQLVTVEVLIDTTMATEEATQVNFVVKNEELPLQRHNHCRQMFDSVRQAIAEDRHWQLVENVPG